MFLTNFYIKHTLKLFFTYHPWETPEDQLNGSLLTQAIKKLRGSWYEGWKHKKGWTPHPPVVKNGEGYLSCRDLSSLINEGSQLYTRLTRLEHQCQSPQQLAVKIIRDSVWVRWRAAENPASPLKGPKTHSFTYKHLP